MADRTPQELSEALNDLAADCYDETIKPDLIAAANLLSGLEGQEQWIVLSRSASGSKGESVVYPARRYAESLAAARHENLGHTEVRIKHRTVYESQWTDIEEEG